MSIKEKALETMLRETTSFIFVKDRRGTYIAASDAFAALFGVSSGTDIVGKTDRDLVENKEHALHFEKADDKVMENGVPLYDLIEPNFTNAADVRWTSTSKYPIRGEDGKVIGLIAEGHVIDSRYERRTAYEYDLRSVVELSHDAYGAMICDVTSGKIIEFHNRGEWKTELAAGMSWHELLQTAREHVRFKNGSVEELFRMAEYQNIVTMYRGSRRAFNIEYCWEENGTTRWVRNDVHIFTNPDTGHLLVAFVLHDIGAEHAERDELVRQAYRDSLTGLLNHDETVKRIQAFLQRGQKGCLLMIDVDDFKHVNDTFGHPAGDRVLVRIGDILKTSFRTGDVIGRVGGDEFMVFAVDLEGTSVAWSKAQAVLEKIKDSGEMETDCRVTVSVGIAACMGMENFEQLYSRADAMLYTSKKSGKGRVTAEGDRVG
jgi:diguanylate cyclase (GGDEF)-like protein/PAS domain S-box-containing protein